VTNLPSTPSVRLVRSRLAACILAAGFAFGGASVAEAQFGGRSGMASLFTPDFLGRDIPVFVQALGLEEWQRPILEALVEDYETNFNTAADGVRAGMGQFRDVAAGASAERVVELISQPLVAWAAEKRRLREDFLEGVRGTLAEDQLEQWPRLERTLRREKSLPMGELSGESLDLTVVMRELRAPMTALEGAAEAVESYEVALDAALAARDAELDASIAPLLRAMSSGDSNSGVASQERIMQWRIAVRQAQEDGIASIRAALGEEYGAQFERRAMQRAFPMVYRPDPVEPLLESARALPDLSDEQRSRLDAVAANFEAEFTDVRNMLVATYRETEPKEPRRRTELARRRSAGEQVRMSDPPEVETAKAAREDLFTKYRLLILEILTEEQKQAIPGLAKPDASIPRKPVLGRDTVGGVGLPEGGVVEIEDEEEGGEGDGGKGKGPGNAKPAEPAHPASGGFGTAPGGGRPVRAD